MLAQQADVLWLDEPFGGLDLPTQQWLLAVLSEERARGATVLVATHQLTVAFRCDLAVLLDGRIVAFGPPAEACKEANLVRAFGLLEDLPVQPSASLLFPDHTATRPLLDADEGTS